MDLRETLGRRRGAAKAGLTSARKAAGLVSADSRMHVVPMYEEQDSKESLEPDHGELILLKSLALFT